MEGWPLTLFFFRFLLRFFFQLPNSSSALRPIPARVNRAQRAAVGATVPDQEALPSRVTTLDRTRTTLDRTPVDQVRMDLALLTNPEAHLEAPPKSFQRRSFNASKFAPRGTDVSGFFFSLPRPRLNTERPLLNLEQKTTLDTLVPNSLAAIRLGTLASTSIQARMNLVARSRLTNPTTTSAWSDVSALVS